MANNQILTRNQIPVGTAAYWEKINPLLHQGEEIIIESRDTNGALMYYRKKIGDGERRYIELPFVDQKTVGGLPIVTQADNGKVLTVKNGQWIAQTQTSGGLAPDIIETLSYNITELDKHLADHDEYLASLDEHLAAHDGHLADHDARLAGADQAIEKLKANTSHVYVLDGIYVMNQAIDLEPYRNKFCEAWFEMFGRFYRGVYVTDAGRGLCIYTNLVNNTQFSTSGFPEETVTLYDGQEWYNDEYELVFSGNVVPEWLYKLITENSVGAHTLHGTYIMNHPIDLTPYYNKTCTIDFLYGGDPCTRISVSDRDSIFAYDDEYGWFSIYSGGWEDGINTLTFDNAEVPEWLYKLVIENGEETLALNGAYLMNERIDLAPYVGKSYYGYFSLGGATYESFVVETDNIHGLMNGYDGPFYMTSAGWYARSIDFHGNNVPKWLYTLITENGTKQ